MEKALVSATVGSYCSSCAAQKDGGLYRQKKKCQLKINKSTCVTKIHLINCLKCPLLFSVCFFSNTDHPVMKYFHPPSPPAFSPPLVSESCFSPCRSISHASPGPLAPCFHPGAVIRTAEKAAASVSFHFFIYIFPPRSLRQIRKGKKKVQVSRLTCDCLLSKIA